MQDNVITKVQDLRAVLVKSYKAVSRNVDKKLLDLVIKSGYLESEIIRYFGSLEVKAEDLTGKLPYVFNMFATLGYSPTTRSVSYSQTLAHTRVINTALVYGAVFSRACTKPSPADIRGGSALVGPEALLESGVDMHIKTKFLDLKYTRSTNTFNLTPKTPRGKFVASKEIENV